MISVLRLSHRVRRDHRVTTHCALVARAFGADEFVFSGERDKSIVESVRDVTDRWGGPFSIKYVPSWRKWLSKRGKARIIHLTMYGQELTKVMPKIRGLGGDLVIIVGGEKVPSEVYEKSDFNVSVTSQPHSEVAGIALLLDRYFQGGELSKEFSNAEIKVIPQAKGKKVVKSES